MRRVDGFCVLVTLPSYHQSQSVRHVSRRQKQNGLAGFLPCLLLLYSPLECSQFCLVSMALKLFALVVQSIGTIKLLQPHFHIFGFGVLLASCLA